MKRTVTYPHFKSPLLIGALGAIATGCGSGVSGGPDLTVDILNPAATLAAMMAQSVGLQGGPESDFLLSSVGTLTSGQATATQLKSLKYYIKEIRICKDLQTSGTGYSNAQGCLSLYKNDKLDNYDSYDVATAMADTAAGKYVDLMSKADLAKIRQNPVAAQAGEYNYGVVDWYRPVKVTAQVNVGGQTYYTKPGVVTTFTNNGQTGTYTKIENITTGPAAEATADLGNGGNWFKFQSPLILNGSDPIKLDLVFNPEGLIAAADAASNYPIRDGDNGKAFFIPLLDLSPVAHKASERAMKETYRVIPPGNQVQVRMELYYVEGDAGKTIYGVDLKTLIVDNTVSVMHPQKVSFIEASGSTLNFQNYQKTAMIQGFTRLATPGATGTAILDCTTLLFHLGNEVCGGATTTATYTYDGASVVE